MEIYIYLTGWKPPIPVLLCELFDDPILGSSRDERWVGVLRALYYYPLTLSYIVNAALVKREER